MAPFGSSAGHSKNVSEKGRKKGRLGVRKWGGSFAPSPHPRGEFWGVQGGGQQEEGKDLRRLVDPKGSADDGKRLGLSESALDVSYPGGAKMGRGSGGVGLGIRPGRRLADLY